ncbi:hypothetical protein BDZ89DRAFT_1037896 [Hymenopellis radicata]|nr:hypothetical protein BDZ89DRAFT_1037896 [Hymenopellis radicata]
MNAHYMDEIYFRLKESQEGVGRPEFRVRILISGWCANAGVHWIGLDIGLALVGCETGGAESKCDGDDDEELSKSNVHRRDKNMTRPPWGEAPSAMRAIRPGCSSQRQASHPPSPPLRPAPRKQRSPARLGFSSAITPPSYQPSAAHLMPVTNQSTQCPSQILQNVNKSIGTTGPEHGGRRPRRILIDGSSAPFLGDIVCHGGVYRAKPDVNTPLETRFSRDLLELRRRTQEEEESSVGVWVKWGVQLARVECDVASVESDDGNAVRHVPSPYPALVGRQGDSPHSGMQMGNSK